MILADPLGELVFVARKVCHYCEAVRWALDRSGFAYREDCNRPLHDVLAARRAAFSGQKNPDDVVPRLLNGTEIIPKVLPILRWIDGRVGPAQRLFPEEPGPAAEVEQWVEFFHTTLGPQMFRAIIDFALLDRKLCLSILRYHGMSRLFIGFFGLIHPLFGPYARRKLGYHDAGLKDALAAMDEVFRRVSDRLSDGRRYLLGDRFSAADLMFAAYSTTLVSPEGCPTPLPPLDDLTEPLQAAVKRFRETPAGAFATRLYAEDRRRHEDSVARRCA